MEPDVEKVRLFLSDLTFLIDSLERDKRIVVHNHINQFNYMTQKEELTLLLTKYDSTKAILETTGGIIQKKFNEVSRQYDDDCAWIRNL